MKLKLKMLDLFSGIGGFTLAAQKHGIETIGFCEIDHFCRKVLNKHWPAVPIHEDITKLARRIYDCEPESEEGAVECPRCNTDFGDCDCIGTDQFTDTYGFPNIISGGFPCQDISFNGKGAGLEGARSGLWSEMHRIIDQFQPEWVVAENVSALVKRGLDRVLQDLAQSGYICEWHCVPATAVGAEHKRERIWIVAYHKSLGVQGLWPKGFKIPHTLDKTLLSLRTSDGQWKVEPDLRRVVDGVPDVSHRLKAVGNSIVPQMAEIIFEKIVAVSKTIQR